MLTDFEGPTKKNPFILRHGDDNWGPYKFRCSYALPSDVTINSATATGYDTDGNSADIIELDTIEILDDGTTIQLRFQSSDDITMGFYYIKFELELSNGATKYFRFGPVTIHNWSI